MTSPAKLFRSGIATCQLLDCAGSRQKRVVRSSAAHMMIPENLPVTFRLPKPGERDAYFNLPRATYYALEADGQLKLVRLRQKGRRRGTTLVATADVLAVLEAAEKGKRSGK